MSCLKLVILKLTSAKLMKYDSDPGLGHLWVTAMGWLLEIALALIAIAGVGSAIAAAVAERRANRRRRRICATLAVKTRDDSQASMDDRHKVTGRS
jgi:hypothetical protein